MSRIAALIDRDGTMGYDPRGGNFRTPRDYIPFPGTSDAFSQLKSIGLLVLIVTNQSCIARGLDGGYDFAAEFRLSGADDWFICPHDKQDHCSCRKPDTGLIEQAKAKYDLDLSRCYMIGDRWSDMVAGGKMGMKLIPVLTGFGRQTMKDDRIKWQEYIPAYTAENLPDAANWIANQLKKQE